MSAEQVGSFTGLATGIIGIFGTIVAVANHKRIRSNCCGHKVVVSMDVEATTPGHCPNGSSPKDLKITIPVSQSKPDEELKSDTKTG